MNPILSLVLVLAGLRAGDPSDAPATEVRLTVIRDPYTSSEQVTLCRVRADNLGSRSWSGRALAFEVRVPGASPAVKARGRFGLTLEPHGSLETLVALPGRHDRFEVVILPQRNAPERDTTIRRKRGKSRRPAPKGPVR